MSDLKEAVEQVKRFAPFMQSVIDLAGAADELGGAEHAVSEAKVQLAGVRSDIDAAKGELTKAKADLKKAQETAVTVITEAQTRAEAITSDAGASVAGIKAGADKAAQEADQIIVDAKEQAKFIGAAADAKAKAADQTVNDAERTLAALEAKIANARAKAAEILGA